MEHTPAPHPLTASVLAEHGAAMRAAVRVPQSANPLCHLVQGLLAAMLGLAFARLVRLFGAWQAGTLPPPPAPRPHAPTSRAPRTPRPPHPLATLLETLLAPPHPRARPRRPVTPAAAIPPATPHATALPAAIRPAPIARATRRPPPVARPPVARRRGATPRRHQSLPLVRCR